MKVILEPRRGIVSFYRQREGAIQSAKLRYLIIRTFQAADGGFCFSIMATDDLEEIVRRRYFGEGYEIVDTTTKERVHKP